MSDSYTSAALRGLGMEGDDSYTSAALRGFGDESYTSAALRGFGDDSYTDAALRGMGRMKASRRRGGKKLKGGIAFSTIAAALSLIPTAIKGAHAIYKWIKGSGIMKSKKGGRALILDGAKRSEFIKSLREQYKGRKLAALYPYTLSKAEKHAAIRKRNLGPKVVEYLSSKGDLDKALFDTKAMKKYKSKALDELSKAHAKQLRETNEMIDDIILPTKQTSTSKNKPKKSRGRRNLARELAALGLGPGTIKK